MEYPVFEGILRLDFPNIPEDKTGDSFPCPEGYAPVQYSPPTIEHDDPVYGYSEITPKNINGTWTRQWYYYELNAEDRFARAKHRQKLADNVLYTELERAKMSAQLQNEVAPHWAAYAKKLEAWLDEFPRVNPKPVMTRSSQTLNNPGNTPNVIG
jgi:hypothetical protein